MFKLFTITAGVLLALAVGSYAKKVCTDACGESDDQSACLEKLWGRDASEDSIESATNVSLGGYTEDYGDPWGFATPWDNLDYNEDALSMHGPAGARCTVDECRETFVNHQEQCLVMTDYSGVTCTTCATLPEPASALCLRFVYRAGGALRTSARCQDSPTSPTQARDAKTTGKVTWWHTHTRTAQKNIALRWLASFRIKMNAVSTAAHAGCPWRKAAAGTLPTTVFGLQPLDGPRRNQAHGFSNRGPAGAKEPRKAGKTRNAAKKKARNSATLALCATTKN